MDDIRLKIVNEAKSWIGTPYKHYTSQKGLGCDCGLYIMKVYENVGLITYKHPAYYPQDWAFHNPIGELFVDIVENYCVSIDEKDLKIGDMILYKFGKSLSHASIVIENNMIIHSQVGIGVTISNRYNSVWSKREKEYYSLCQVE